MTLETNIFIAGAERNALIDFSRYLESIEPEIVLNSIYVGKIEVSEFISDYKADTLKDYCEAHYQRWIVKQMMERDEKMNSDPFSPPNAMY